MSNLEKSNIIDQMINENSDYTILDYLKLMGELEVIERFTVIGDLQNKIKPIYETKISISRSR